MAARRPCVTEEREHESRQCSSGKHQRRDLLVIDDCQCRERSILSQSKGVHLYFAANFARSRRILSLSPSEGGKAPIALYRFSLAST